MKFDIFKFADEFFTRNIKDPEIADDSKNWHKCLQKISRYRNNSKILNLQSGPVAEIRQ